MMMRKQKICLGWGLRPADLWQDGWWRWGVGGKDNKVANEGNLNEDEDEHDEWWCCRWPRLKWMRIPICLISGRSLAVIWSDSNLDTNTFSFFTTPNNQQCGLLVKFEQRIWWNLNICFPEESCCQWKTLNINRTNNRKQKSKTMINKQKQMTEHPYTCFTKNTVFVTTSWKTLKESWSCI